MFGIAVSLPQKWPRTTHKKSRLVELEKLIHNNDGRLIDMIFDKEGGTWRAIGDHHGKVNNLISQSTRNVVPPHYPSWDKMPPQLKQQIVNLQWV